MIFIPLLVFKSSSFRGRHFIEHLSPLSLLFLLPGFSLNLILDAILNSEGLTSSLLAHTFSYALTLISESLRVFFTIELLLFKIWSEQIF